MTFKPNVSDLRNSKALTLSRLLFEQNLTVEFYDPVAADRFPEDIGCRLFEDPFISNKTYDAVILAVPHDVFMAKKTCIVDLVNPGGVIVDLVSALDQFEIESLGKIYWSL